MINQKKIKLKKEIRIKTPMLRSDLCDFRDAYILVKADITVDKKTFTNNDLKAPNNTAADATATNNENNNEFGEKCWFLKITHHLLIVLQRQCRRLKCTNANVQFT